MRSIMGPAGTDTVHVMTYNVRYPANDPGHLWSDRRPAMARLLNAEQPTVVGTQEALDGQLREIAADLPDRQNYECLCEAAIARTKDGSLLAVMRTGSYQPLYQARSTDDGANWSTPEPVLAGPNRLPVPSVFPDLILLDNGTLALYVGRPGQAMLASTDGNGRSWSEPVMVDYLNSGNGTQLPIGRNRLLAFGDRGAEWTPNTPAHKAVWARVITIGR
jgi:hypothetical protein